MKRAIDYLTDEEIRALQRAAASLARNLKYLKKEESRKKQNSVFNSVKSMFLLNNMS